jgi:DNA-binding MarR family transcriptional regulator
VALDIDPRHGGAESLAALEREHGALPATVTVNTGGGGQHIYFRHPGEPIKNSAMRLGAGLDVKADAGYVVAPPSLHASGQRYEWQPGHGPDDLPLADLPGWLLEKLRTPKLLALPGGAATGERLTGVARNNYLTSKAGTMWVKGMSLEAVTAGLLAENKARFDPPLDDQEVLRITRSVGSYPAGSPESPLAAAIRAVAEAPPAFRAEVDVALKAISKQHGCSIAAVRDDYQRLRQGIEGAQGAQATPEPEEERQKARQAAGELLTCPDILSRVVEAVHALGVAGEERAIKLIYLAVTSRLLERIVSLIIKSQTSAGKSFTMHTTLRVFPESAIYLLTLSSARALIFTEESLAHRHVVQVEAVGMDEGTGAYIVRSLISEGQVTYETVEHDAAGRLVHRRIVKAGPTGLLMTTTKAVVFADNETRLLSLSVTDDPAQTARIMLKQAEEAEDPKAPGDESGPALAPWYALQRFLELSPRAVRIPFAKDLAKRCRADAVRMRRDFPQALSLIRAHALLHQETRERDEQGRILATPADYAAVHVLVADLVAEGTGAAVSPAVRAVVEAVTRLSKETGSKPVTVSEAAKALGIEKSTCTHRVKRALRGNWLVDERTHKNRPAALLPGEPLPDGAGVLPDPQIFFVPLPPKTSSTIQPRHSLPAVSGTSGLNTPISTQAGLNSTQVGLNTSTSTQMGAESLEKALWVERLKSNPGGQAEKIPGGDGAESWEEEV